MSSQTIEASTQGAEEVRQRPKPPTTVFTVIVALSVSHFLNDVMQSLLTAIYPILSDTYALDFGQVGLITLTFQFTASLLQPVVGIAADKRPLPFSMAIAMSGTFIGLLMLGGASDFMSLLVAAGLVGFGSAIFHPEASRVARMAAGLRPGLAQSLFQVGGNFGSAAGPLIAAYIVLPLGQGSIRWFAIVALVAILILFKVGKWYKGHLIRLLDRGHIAVGPMTRAQIVAAITILVLLTFSKAAYGAGLSSFYTFFLIERFGVTIKASQLLLFVYLAAVAVGTVIGGPVGDRFGRKVVLWGSVLGALPFTLALPWVSLPWAIVLTSLIGIIMSSAFPAIIVYAQELLPGGVGLVSGLLYGLSFGAAGVAAALLGQLGNARGIEFVFQLCAWLPIIGILVVFLPGGKAEAPGGEAAGATA